MSDATPLLLRRLLRKGEAARLRGDAKPVSLPMTGAASAREYLALETLADRERLHGQVALAERSGAITILRDRHRGDGGQLLRISLADAAALASPGYSAVCDARRRGPGRHEALAQAPNLVVDFREIADEDHGTVIPAAIGRGVDFFFNGPDAVPPVPGAAEYMGLGADGRYRLRMQVRALPDLHRIPWLNGLKASLKAGLDANHRQRLHDERHGMDARYGSRPHARNAD